MTKRNQMKANENNINGQWRNGQINENINTIENVESVKKAWKAISIIADNMANNGVSYQWKNGYVST